MLSSLLSRSVLPRCQVAHGPLAPSAYTIMHGIENTMYFIPWLTCLYVFFLHMPQYGLFRHLGSGPRRENWRAPPLHERTTTTVVAWSNDGNSGGGGMSEPEATMVIWHVQTKAAVGAWCSTGRRARSYRGDQEEATAMQWEQAPLPAASWSLGGKLFSLLLWDKWWSSGRGS